MNWISISGQSCDQHLATTNNLNETTHVSFRIKPHIEVQDTEEKIKNLLNLNKASKIPQKNIYKILSTTNLFT